MKKAIKTLSLLMLCGLLLFAAGCGRNRNDRGETMDGTTQEQPQNDRDSLNNSVTSGAEGNGTDSVGTDNNGREDNAISNDTNMNRTDSAMDNSTDPSMENSMDNSMDSSTEDSTLANPDTLGTEAETVANGTSGVVDHNAGEGNGISEDIRGTNKKTGARSIGNGSGNTLGNMAEDTGNVVGDIVDGAGNAVSDIADGISNGVRDITGNPTGR